MACLLPDCLLAWDGCVPRHEILLLFQGQVQIAEAWRKRGRVSKFKMVKLGKAL